MLLLLEIQQQVMAKIIVLTEAPDNRKLYFSTAHIRYFYEAPDFDGNTTKVFVGDSNFDVIESAETIRELLTAD
ncbi:hypothetical protein [Mucilaginibacter lacusdianchii]|uniref:hypothetical protein n=1 Tax=Mucilaginibacter lacusdianchii TaxID=2684211 RepID=UPI00131ACD94|nr:hypothetical protein [Mucilaginibacter sp. JXJ CY 39]